MNFKEWLDIQEAMALKGDYKGGIFQRLVAARYMLAPTLDPSAEPAFQDLAKKISRQKEFLDSKYQMKPTQDDPYHSMKAMTKDIEKQKASGVRRPVIPTYAEPPAMDGDLSGGHPIYNNDDNVTQRYVHDVIAHYFGQHKFSARGEYGAYNRHLKTLCNRDQVKAGQCLAAKAIFTEVVAQTSCYYVYGDFVDQKAVILDDFDHANIGALASNSPLNQFFVVEGKVMKKRENFNWREFQAFDMSLARELTHQSHGRPLTHLEPISPMEEENASPMFRNTAGKSSYISSQA